MTKREFLTAGIGAGLALAERTAAFSQTANRTSSRKAKTTKLFKSPQGSPTELPLPGGLWIGEQKLSGAQPLLSPAEPKTLTEAAWLVDWNGKLLKTVETPSRNTSGMAVGGGYVWMVANAPPQGVFQVDMNSAWSATVRSRWVPASDGGGCHGALWQDGKLWIASLRLRGNLRVDPKTWEPEFLIPFYQAPDRVRYHGIAWDDGSIWQVVGNDSKRYSEYRPCLVRYEAATGKVLETVDFLPNSCDPHGWRCSTAS
jgi:hypothetical protein